MEKYSLKYGIDLSAMLNLPAPDESRLKYLKWRRKIQKGEDVKIFLKISKAK